MRATTTSPFAWFNGELQPIAKCAPSVASISLHLGTSVFDGAMVYWNDSHFYFHRVEDHLRRFVAAAERLDLPVSWSCEELLNGLKELLARGTQQSQYVRPIAYRRPPELWVTGSRGHSADVAIFTVLVPRDEDHLLNCHISPVERISSRAVPAQTKVSGAYVNSYHARASAERAGFDDGIMLDRDNNITEASAANFFAIADGQLVTPVINSEIFPGITRQVILSLAEDLRIPVHERTLTPDDLLNIDAAFLCSTLMEVRGIQRIGSTTLATADDPVFSLIRDRFRQLVHS